MQTQKLGRNGKLLALTAARAAGGIGGARLASIAARIGGKAAKAALVAGALAGAGQAQAFDWPKAFLATGVAAIAGRIGYSVGKGPPVEVHVSVPGRPTVNVVREMDLREGDHVKVVLSEDPKSNGRKLIAHFRNETSNEEWKERYANTRTGMESLEAQLQWMKERKARITRAVEAQG